jgi:hypothetical protein
MSRVRLLFLSVMAVFAVAAVASSEASAAAPNWVVEGTAFTGSETVLGLLSNGNASLEENLGSNVFTDILCTAWDATGTILGGNKDAAPNGITFSGCSVSTPSGCSVTNPIVVKAVTSTLLSNETVGLDTWAPTSGTEFTKIVISGTACVVEGSYNITGQAQCEGTLNTEAETFPCLFNKNSGNGQLKIGKEVADFLAHFLFLLKGPNDTKKWGASTTI